MAVDAAQIPPDVSPREGGARLALAGDWTLAASRRLENKAQEVVDFGRRSDFVTIDLSGVSRLDTAGAWLINRARRTLATSHVGVALEHVRPEHGILLEEAAYRDFEAPGRKPCPLALELLSDIGRAIVYSLKEFYRGVAFLGEFVAVLGYLATHLRRFRGTSLVAHMELIGLRSAPIVILINLLVGAIVAQQGIYQLIRFGATTYAVDLIGILVLRELGVLLTSIMIAGRSGSAITAEIGSMKMREEIDALRVMGLSVIEVLVAPRVLALVLSLPILTFIADMSALFGGMLVSWGYGGISPAAFASLLKEAIGFNTFMVGIIKAPFMALVIGLIAMIDGLATQGSAESLGRQVTSSVVKSIFMVIVLDGLFAIFFASIHY
ncbi:ABC transporter permease [Methylocystis iwaonis]|uniref:ABC transporter permease n=1 Tax=Methylocystis iwaonis TaxID=2885079 RepID=A0ABM8E555_9HYPH|nr:MlaE family lipid ABC transporter permease subunit [Methylocystis iwaonis]BDV33107.1 ABC transporter permease [Methylocystis iwaonis]